MCLSIPGKISKIENKEYGLVDFNGVQKKVNLSLIKNPKKNEWVTVHAGFAIGKVDQKEAKEILKLYEEAS